MSEAARDRTDYLSLVSAAADQLARLGYLWSPMLGEGARLGKEARLITFTPVARRNGFQSLLYRAAWELGFAPIPVVDPYSLRRIPWPGEMICHFHWLGGITAQSVDEHGAQKRVDAFEGLIQDLKKQGRKIVWTVHNVLPHDAKWPQQDLQIRKLMIREADAIHIMTAGTGKLLKEHCELPEEKVFLVRHPAYTHFYPDTITRYEARAQLGVPENALAFLTFGAIRRYKGYEKLIEAFERMPRVEGRREPFLIIAGGSDDDTLSRDILAWASARRDVLAVVKSIQSGDVQLYYRAADVAICPYNATLNSGAAMLAVTFGKPVIGPGVGGFLDNVGSTCAWLYDPLDGSVESLLEAMKDSVSDGTLQAKSEAALQRARALNADALSSRFFAQLETIVYSTDPGRSFHAMPVS